MKNIPIADELRDFLAHSGVKATVLARESGVSDAIISFVVTGRRRDMHSRHADALREAMRRLSAKEAPDA